MRNSVEVLSQEKCLLEIAAAVTFDNPWVQHQSLTGYQITNYPLIRSQQIKSVCVHTQRWEIFCHERFQNRQCFPWFTSVKAMRNYFLFKISSLT